MVKLPARFYRRDDALAVARDLIGAILCTRLPPGPGHAPVLSAVRITETEAYTGPEDRASHAFGNRRTARTETMFRAGGVAYIYLCYGLHHLFNVVTGPRDMPQAVLIRSGQPLAGIEWMMRRRRVSSAGKTLCAGPGRLAQALGLTVALDGTALHGPEIWIAPGTLPAPATTDEIVALPRVGVGYAGEYARRPYRFVRRSSAGVRQPAPTVQTGAASAPAEESHPASRQA